MNSSWLKVLLPVAKELGSIFIELLRKRMHEDRIKMLQIQQIKLTPKRHKTRVKKKLVRNLLEQNKHSEALRKPGDTLLGDKMKK
jgi:hypothetical protein